MSAIPTRRYVNVFVYAFLNVALFYYWYAFPVANTQFLDGIPQIGTSNQYVSARYGWLWWHYWLLGLNQLLPLALVWAVANADVEEWTRLHLWLSRNAVILNLWVWAVLTVFWLGFCSYPYSAGYTACNDYRWCCRFPSNPWCPNTATCVPDVPFSQLFLSMSSEGFQHWAFAPVFLLLAIWNKWLNDMAREFSVLK